MKSTIERITGKLDDEMFGVLWGITQEITFDNVVLTDTIFRSQIFMDKDFYGQ